MTPAQKAFLTLRVNFAVSVILRGQATTRNFDGCFEEGDGDQVAAAIYARALENPRLMDALPRYLDMGTAQRAHAEIFQNGKK